MATWLNSIGDWNTNVNAGIFGGKNAAGVMQQASGFGKAIGGLGINANNIGGIANTIGQIGTGLLAGQNQTGVGNALQTIGGLASNIPGVGGLIGAGVGVVGGLVNAAFGSHINEEFVQQTQLGANQVGSQVFNANTNGDLLNDWQNMTQMSNVSKSEVGSDGWFSNKASRKTRELNRQIDEANQRQLANFNIAAQNVDTSNDLRILQNMAAYGGPINSFRKYYGTGGSLFDTPQFFSFEPQTYDTGGYLGKAKALIRQNEGWRDKPYSDTPKGKNWRSVGYGFNDSGFRDKYPEGISKHYEHGITKKQAEEELDYFLNKAEKQLKSIYGKQWNDFTDSQKAAILDTYYQRPASVGKSSRFYKAVTAGEDAGRYLGVAGYDRRNKIRQDIFGGDYSGYSDTESNPSALQEVTPFTPVIHDLDLSDITPTEVKALELDLTSPTFDLSMFGKPMTTPTQQAVPTVGTVEDFLASYEDFDENLFEDGGKLNIKDMNIYDFGGGLTHGADWDTGINWVNEGGSHGENPLGGVQMGVDEQGIPNLVEQDEAIWNGDYVFSKRMKVPKKLREKYGLKDDATFADAVAKLTKESEERPMDAISRNTQEHILGELADSQEELRAVKAQRAMEKEQQLQEDFLTGVQFGLGGALFADGGGIHIDPSKRGTFKAQASKMGMGVQEAASHILANKEDYSPAMVRKANFARNASHWHEDGGFLNEPFLEANTFDYGGALKWLQEHYPNVGNKEAIARVLDKRAKAVGYRGTNTNDKVYDYQDAFDAMQAGNKPIDESNEKLFESLVKDGMPRKVAFGLAYPQALSYPYAGDNYGSKHSAAREAAYNKLIRNYTAQVPTSNRGNNTRGRSTQAPSTTAAPAANVVSAPARGTQAAPASSGSTGTRRVTTAAKPKAAAVSTNGTNKYDRYLNGSDGFSTPWGFKVDNKGKATDYTPEYIEAANKLTVADINRFADEHPNDLSLQSFIRNNGGTREKAFAKLTDDYVRKGAQDGNYGFLHHVTDQIGKETATVPADYNWEQEAPWLFGDVVAPATVTPDPMAEIARDKSTPTRSVSVTDNGTNFKVTPAPQTVTRSGITDATSGAVDGITRSPFKPKQTWTRYAPLVMSGLMGLKEMLTPADYGNADSIMEAAYQVGSPVSIGTEYLGDYRKRDPFDERYLMNIINQRGAATNRNMMNLSGGNRAAAMAGILSNDLTTQMSLAEAARQSYLANRADDAQVAEFNRGTNQFNATAQNQRNQFLAGLNSQRQQAMLSGISQGARLRQAIKDQRDAAISANLTNLAQGLGDLGKENGYYNMLGGLNEEGVLKYFYGNDWRTMFNNING